MSASLIFPIILFLLIVGLVYSVWFIACEVRAFLRRHVTVCSKPRPLPWEDRLSALGANPYRGRYS